MFWIGISYLILIFLGLIVDDYILTKRHIKLFKQAMTEELRRLKAESLNTPGGINKEE
jgi:dsRNA-specific ribonuclease